MNVKVNRGLTSTTTALHGPLAAKFGVCDLQPVTTHELLNVLTWQQQALGTFAIILGIAVTLLSQCSKT